MKKIMRFSLLAVAYALVSACASTSDVENLQAQVTGLDNSVKQAAADASRAQSTAADAAAKAEAASAAANRAAELSEETNNKLDRKFKRSMMK